MSGNTALNPMDTPRAFEEQLRRALLQRGTDLSPRSLLDAAINPDTWHASGEVQVALRRVTLVGNPIEFFGERQRMHRARLASEILDSAREQLRYLPAQFDTADLINLAKHAFESGNGRDTPAALYFGAHTDMLVLAILSEGLGTGELSQSDLILIHDESAICARLRQLKQYSSWLSPRQWRFLEALKL